MKSNSVNTVNTAPTFSAPDGKLVVPVLRNDIVYSVIQQADGKLVVAGTSENPGTTNDFSLIRLNTDGSLDTSFGTDGKLVVPVGSGYDVGRSVIQQADGKLVVAGYSTVAGSTYSIGSNGDFSLIRLNADGSLDTSFGTDGKLIVTVGTSTDVGYSVIQQADSKLVVAGISNNGSDYDFSLIRLNADGSLDTSFGTDGKLVVPVGSSKDHGFSVIQQADGKLVVAGTSSNGTNDDFSLIRLNADGSLDTSFDGDGKAIIPVVPNRDDYGYSVIQQSDGKLVVAGQSTDSTGSNTDFSLIRLNADGSLDTSFGTDGKLVVPVGSSKDHGYSVIQQADGKLVVAGTSSNGKNFDFSLIRLNADGSLDTSFDGDGKVLLEMSVQAMAVQGYSVIQQSDGKLVVAGYSNYDGYSDFGLIRLNTDGSLDTSFSPAENTLGNTVGQVEGYSSLQASAVPLSPVAHVFDAELVATGSYSGASLSLSRQGGANAQDVFSAKAGGTLSVLTQGAYFSVDGVTIGLVTTNAGGLLAISFNTNATQSLVDKALQQIAYNNTSDAPPASVLIDWTFDDGNTGSQGTGGALAITGTTTVNITATNDAPTLTGVPGTAQNVTAGQAAALADFTVADSDGAGVNLTVTLTPTNGTLGGVTDANGSLPGIQLTGTAASINTALAGATFTATAAGVASIGISVTDGVGNTPTTGTYSINAAPITFGPQDDFVVLQPGTPAITGAGEGNDVYLIPSSLLPAGKNITISDASGTNNLQLAPGLQIAFAQVSTTALKLTMGSGATVTILGADTFTYDVGGNLSAGLDPSNQSYTQFAENTLGVSVPVSGLATSGALTIGLVGISASALELL